ncbi:T9SS type A sorting domain-containing protein [Taibaiella soli]|uniref:Secretion system C-terminal sorting domain-containing protein n=1 Tax=Taibaiella soli TaxID=1649169 RepID=A0A2W2AV18_9BACT|nr:T9SS type A sorting domain-containing protein [Taibaiella soli]PZF71528.1 hypothetical protein DN068_17970 [Taibaiella soli]
MKNLSNRVLTIASLCVFLSQTTQAQDTYWSMANQQVYNTKTGTLTTLPAWPASPRLDYYYPTASNPLWDPKGVFSSAGNLLFTGSQNYLMFDGGPISTLASRGVAPLGGSCTSKYAVINAYQTSGSHTSTCDVSILDVSSGVPTPVSGSTLNAYGDFNHFDAVVAPKQTNGDRYVYFISALNPLSNSNPFVEQYTLHADGTTSSANYSAQDNDPTHVINSRAKVSNDGAYVAYQIADGTIMTFNTATQQFVPGPKLTTFYGLEGVNLNGTVRWFVSLNSRMVYFDQGSTSTITAANAGGIISDIALGPDGLLYAARGWQVTGGPAADLMTLDPTITGLQTPKLKASNCVYFNGVSYHFGNQITGENTNEVSSIYTDFTVNGGRGTLLHPKNLYTCTGFDLFDLTRPVQSSINISIVQVDATDNPVAGGFNFGGYSIPNSGLGVYNLKNLPGTNGTWLATHPGIYRITMYTTDGCGRLASHVEYVQVIVANATVDFKMIGPSDNNGTQVCPGGVQDRYIYSYYFTPFAQPVTTPPCVQGWLGVSTLGITQGTITGTTLTPANYPGATTPYEVRVEELKSDGSTPNKTTPILKKNPGSIGLAFTFNPKTSPSYYFTTNYETIKNNYVYKTVVSMNSVECGIIKDSSYFKIIDGGLSSDDGGSGFPEQWRMVEVPASEFVNVYPNPTTNSVHFAWNSNAEGKDATISIVDVLGRMIYNQTLAETKGSNDRLVDLSTVASGTYHYTLKTSNGEKTGTVVKQ